MKIIKDMNSDKTYEKEAVDKGLTLRTKFAYAYCTFIVCFLTVE